MEFLLNNFLSSTEQTITKPLADSICSTFDQSKYQNQHEINHRWFNCINSLLASKNDSAISLGARLAKLSLQKNPNCLTSQGARWILACQNLIARNEPLDHICLSQIIQLVLNIFEWSSRWPDFARENCDPKAIINLARALIGISQEATQDNSVPSLGLQTLAILITRYASIIRPLASQLQTLALNNLLSQDNSISQSATSLLSQLYRLSGKTDASASWAKTIKATIGTIDILLDSLLSPFLKESDLIPPRDPPLATLEISTQELVYSSDLTSTLQNTQLASYRIPLLLRRVERLINLLITMLSQPTERSVCIPLGELCTLVHRLLLLGKAQNHDRADQTWKLSWEALGSMVTLRAMGCRLIARVAECVTIRLTPFTTQILTILASEIEANSDPGSGHAAPDVSVMYGTYARIISRCPCNPDVVKTTLEPIIKLLLQDIQPIYGLAPPSDSLPADLTKETKKSRKKSGRYSCDPTWNATVVVDPLDLCIAERALDTLEILFGAIPYGFPTPYLTLTVRAVLSLATHPAFVTPGGKLTSGKTGILTTGSTERSPGLGYASRPSLRLKVMGCLLKCVPIQRLSSQELMGLNLAQSLTGVFQALLGAHDSAGGRLSDLARQGLATLALLARPRVPPVFPTSAHAHLELDVEPVAECDDSDSEHDAPPPPPRTEQAVPAAALRPTDPFPAAPSVASIARKSSVPAAQPWHSDLTSTPANKEEEDPASVGIRKRKSPDEPDALLRPSKKHLDLRPLTVEPDSSDDDNDLAPDGVVKLPQLTFDDDDDDDDDDGAAPETDAERGSS